MKRPLLIATLLAFTLPARGAEAKLSVAFLGVTAGTGVDARTAATVEELLLAGLDETGGFRVVGRSDVARLLGFEREKQMVGCSDGACAAELAGALGVRFIASADLGRLGSSTVLSAKVIDTQTAQVLVRATQTVADDGALPAAVDAIVKRLCDGTADARKQAVPTSAEPASTPGTFAVRAGLGGLVGIAGIGVEYHHGLLGFAMGSGSHLLTGGVSIARQEGGPYLDMHGAWVRTGWIGEQLHPGFGAGATVGWDLRIRRFSVKAGLGAAWRSADTTGSGPLVVDLCAGAVW